MSSERRPPARGWAAVARYLDVAVVAISSAPALALGAPALGYAVGGGAWVAQRAVQELDRRLTAKVAGPQARLGVTLLEAFGRIWLLAGAIVAAGVAGGRADGLTAAVVIFGAYSIAFVIRVLSGPPGSGRRP